MVENYPFLNTEQWHNCFCPACPSRTELCVGEANGAKHLTQEFPVLSQGVVCGRGPRCPLYSCLVSGARGLSTFSVAGHVALLLGTRASSGQRQLSLCWLPNATNGFSFKEERVKKCVLVSLCRSRGVTGEPLSMQWAACEINKPRLH